MGVCHSKKKRLLINSFRVNDFEMIGLIKKGGFGSVYLMKYPLERNKNYILKVMSKAQIINNKVARQVLRERELLPQLQQHPNIAFLLCCFQDECNLYQVMEYYECGDLRNYCDQHQSIDEEQLKFITACIILGLRHIHEKNIIHRDIKPDNLMIDKNGYIKITDFSLCNYYNIDNADDSSGTLNYIAPEVLFRQNHDFRVDYYALGVTLYEIIIKQRPYEGQNRQEVRDAILNGQTIMEKQLNYSDECVSFINKLIQRKPSDRLQNNDSVILDPWLKGLQWECLLSKEIKSPLTMIKAKVNLLNANIEFDDPPQLLQQEPFINLFNNYAYNSYTIPLPQQQ